VLVVGPLTVIENRVKTGQVAAVWAQPSVYALGWDRHDAAVVPGRRHLGRANNLSENFSLTSIQSDSLVCSNRSMIVNCIGVRGTHLEREY
jgi:hypothetical protein